MNPFPVTLHFRSRDGLEGVDQKLFIQVPKVLRLPLMPMPREIAQDPSQPPLEETRRYVLLKTWRVEEQEHALYGEMPEEVSGCSRGGNLHGLVPGGL